jgi:hypothetical protein
VVAAAMVDAVAASVTVVVTEAVEAETTGRRRSDT